MSPKKNRVRVRDADDAIFRPNGNIRVEGDEINRNFGHPIDRDVKVYTIFGKHAYLDADGNPILGDETEDGDAEDNTLAFAKSVSVDGNHPRFYIKKGSDGRLHNPMGLHGEWSHNKYRHHADRREFEYHEVNQRIFDTYVNFLRTKNAAHFRNAEREAF